MLHTTRDNYYSDVFTQHGRLFVEPPPPAPFAAESNNFTLFAPPPLLFDVTTPRRDILERLLEVVHEYQMHFRPGAEDTSEQLNYSRDLEEIRTALIVLEVAKAYASDDVDVNTTTRPITMSTRGVVDQIVAGNPPSMPHEDAEDIRAGGIITTLSDKLRDLVDAYNECISRHEELMLKGSACGFLERRKLLMKEAACTFESFESAIEGAMEKLEDYTM